MKSEVEKQMPKKYEHIVKCPLSKRQRYLYDDFMSRAKTKETLESGNLLVRSSPSSHFRPGWNLRSPAFFTALGLLSGILERSKTPDLSYRRLVGLAKG